jgi:hypothetical protein
VRAVNQSADHDCEPNRVKSERHVPPFHLRRETGCARELDYSFAALLGAATRVLGIGSSYCSELAF